MDGAYGPGGPTKGFHHVPGDMVSSMRRWVGEAKVPVLSSCLAPLKRHPIPQVGGTLGMQDIPSPADAYDARPVVTSWSVKSAREGTSHP